MIAAGSAEARGAAVGGYQALIRQARGQARLLQPHQTVAVLEALAAGAAAVDHSMAGVAVLAAFSCGFVTLQKQSSPTRASLSAKFYGPEVNAAKMRLNY